MTPKIDEFYEDKFLGRLKFKGTLEGEYLFDHFNKLGDKSRWEKAANAITLPIGRFRDKLKAGIIKLSVAPV